jgi:hypothetical protein
MLSHIRWRMFVALLEREALKIGTMAETKMKHIHDSNALLLSW